MVFIECDNRDLQLVKLTAHLLYGVRLPIYNEIQHIDSIKQQLSKFVLIEIIIIYTFFALDLSVISFIRCLRPFAYTAIAKMPNTILMQRIKIFIIISFPVFPLYVRANMKITGAGCLASCAFYGSTKPILFYILSNVET